MVHHSSSSQLYFAVLLMLILILVTCSPSPSTSTEITVQAALPTHTLEPTFTPSPSPTNTPIPSPIATPESTPTTVPQASLSGRIIAQESGQPIAGARVSVGMETATTDASGRYTLTDLPSGQYILSVTHQDYDPGLSAIFTLAAGQEVTVDLTLFAFDTSPYPQDPMLTNPLDPNGAPTKEDAERLARLQGLTGEVVSLEETKLRGEFLVNYKIANDIRAAVVALDHEAWELTDEMDRKWWIIKVCGNLASLLPKEVPIATPVPRPLPPLAEVVVDGLSVRVCASEECAEVGTVQRGTQVEVFGCLADGGWCEVGWSGRRGWCIGRSLRQLAVAKEVPLVEAVLPTKTLEEGKIAFDASRDGNNWDIYVMNADGSGLTRLIDHPEGDFSPAWSLDGQRIAFVSDRDGNSEIYLMNVDGSSLTRLTNNPATDLHPTWSPDGRKIAFYSYPDIDWEKSGIYMMNTDGSELIRLTDGTSPDWSPDGQKIAFDQNHDVYVMNVDGSAPTRLSDFGENPTWSPDGRKITFQFVGDVKLDVYIMNADGSNLRRLTNDPAYDVEPDWSPDGRQVIFASDRDYYWAIYAMNVDGSGLTRLIGDLVGLGRPTCSH